MLLDSFNIGVVTVRYIHKETTGMDPLIGYLAVFPTDTSYYEYMKGVEEGDRLWEHIDSKFMYEVAGFRGETVADLTTLERNYSDFIVVDILE
jgi:aspartokinase